ncbi:MAG: NDP-sugar synthase [Candidatus Bathyarchaeia archaeon]
MREAIILAGGEGWRLKPHTWIPKPLLKINGETLIDRQISWLYSNGFENIIVASDRDDLTKYDVTYSLEERKLGTGGATKRAFEKVSGDRAYVMNVDDIVFYDPNELLDYASKGAGVLLAKPRLPFGRVTLQNRVDVIRFEQNPALDFYVSAGHHVFKRRVVEKFFPDVGDFEFTTMQRLADNRMLQGCIYQGVWFTLNTMKDLIRICDFFKPTAKRIYAVTPRVR